MGHQPDVWCQRVAVAALDTRSLRFDMGDEEEDVICCRSMLHQASGMLFSFCAWRIGGVQEPRHRDASMISPRKASKA